MAFRALVAGIILFFSLFSPAHAVVPELRQPAWSELSREQKQILSPLSRDWDKLEAHRKKKWIGIANRYPSMKPGEQARVQTQMKEWVSLTPDQRKQAREQYKILKKASPEKKEAVKLKWEQYNELPEEEKKRLAKKAASKPSPKPGTARPHGQVSKIPATTPQPLPTPPAPQAPPAPPTPTASPVPAQEDTPATPAQGEPSASADASAQPAPTTPAASVTPAAQQ